MARAKGKLPGPDHIAATLEEYKILDGYFKRHTVEGMDEEAKVCREMVELLPMKINAARRGEQF